MIRLLLAIGRNTFIESIRQPIFFILVLVGIIAQVFNVLLSTYSLGFTEDKEVSADNKLLLDMGLSTIMVIGMLLAAFVATAVVSREIENKTALTVISKPVGRPIFVIGKFLGVAGAILVAVTILITSLMFALRHEVMSTARDHIDGPVALFGSLAIILPVLFAIWCNYFYGWVFSSTAIFTMLPASLIAYLITMTIDKEWAFQSMAVDFKPQILTASLGVAMSVMVLTAIAVALSTRLGQVMTIVCCSGFFLLGLLSNHLLGRHAFDNTIVASIAIVEDPFPGFDLSATTSEIGITLNGPARQAIKPGQSIFYGSNPTGIALAVPPHEAFEGDLGVDADIRHPDHASFVIKSIDKLDLTLINTGGLQIRRLPKKGDYVFLKPTEVNWPVRTAWAALPNFQYFWLVDAITQGHPIPPRYIGMVSIYSMFHIVGITSLGIALFQKRDVG